MSPKISIIVPIYNVGEYLPICIESILNQTFEDFELLLINDGSTDNSYEICKKYKEKDSRIQIFNQHNGGVSSARNIGLSNASGIYTIHVDGDDYVEINMLKELYNLTNNGTTDIVIADFYINTDKSVTNIKQRSNGKKENTIADILDGKLHGSVCNKLLRTSIYKDNNIRFDESIIMCEDLLFSIKFLLHVSSIKNAEKGYFHYVYRNNSCVNSRSPRLFDSYLSVTEKLENLLDNRFKRNITNFKIQIKKELLLYGNDSASEFLKKYPEVTKWILFHPSFKFKSRLVLFLASIGLYTPIRKILRK